MLLENNVSDSMNEFSLVFSLLFIVGLIITYLIIIYFMDQPKKKEIMLRYTAELEKYTQNHIAVKHPEEENHILLVNKPQN